MKGVSTGRQPSISITLGDYWGARVAARRTQLGLSQADLARLCAITQQTVSKIESGSMIPLDRLKVVIAFRLATTPETLFCWPDLTAAASRFLPDPEAAA